MFLKEDEVCITEGRCDDLIPQFFEIVDGMVRVREWPGIERLPLGGVGNLGGGDLRQQQA